MEVLNAAGLTPLSLPSNNNNKPTPRRAVHDHRRLLLAKLSRPFTGGLAALSSVFLSNGLSQALTYEEALSKSFTPDSAGFDIGQFLDGVLKFGSDNPLLIGGGAAVLALPVVLSRVLSEPKPWGVESAKAAYAKLAEEGGAALLDIREGKEVKEVGSPDLRGLKKKAVAIAYGGEDKAGFLKKLSLRFKDPGSTTLFILDKFDGNSALVAELVTANGFKAAYAIRDGAEGARGWLKSELPWAEPKKGITLDFGDINDVIASTFGDSDGLSVTLGLAAATGLGLFAFTEMETVLQLLGSAAIVQFVTKKLWLAEDRKVTLKQAEEFLNTKIAPKELVDEITMIGKALLPAPGSTESLPSAAEATTPEPSTPAAVPATKAEIKEEAPAEPAPAVNSVPRAEVSEGALAGFSSRPLSPYPYYPDFKPPSSPRPSKP